ncbi:MAG: DUF368 domain-containing protein [Clostridia bacterium]|nr:DUF368 domain-containing protein [Clostridia bacterium]
MNFLVNTIKGVFLGAGAILPGISSGVICVVFNIYEKLLDCFFNIFKDFKKSIGFLFPIGIGILLGVFIFGNILLFIFNKYPTILKLIFTCFILISFPPLYKTVSSKHPFKIYYIAFFIIAFGITIYLNCLENSMPYLTMCNSFAYLILSGFLMSIGVVVPGVSSSVILLLLGVYPAYLSAISFINFSILIPMGIGLILGTIFFMFIIKILFKKFYPQTFYAIMGFSISSLLLIFGN